MEMVCYLNLLQQKQLKKPSLILDQKGKALVYPGTSYQWWYILQRRTIQLLSLKRVQKLTFGMLHIIFKEEWWFSLPWTYILFVYSFTQVEHGFITEERYISGVLPFFSWAIKSSWNPFLSTLACFEMDSCNHSSLLNLGSCKHLINFEKPFTYIKGQPKPSRAIVYNRNTKDFCYFMTIICFCHLWIVSFQPPPMFVLIKVLITPP
jgi:hypothetical protein